MEKGWIILHRSIMQHWLWLSDAHFRRWIDLIFKAQYEDKVISLGYRKVNLKRGQVLTSLRALAHDWRTNASIVIKFLTMLRCNEMIEFKSFKNYTIITIRNYNKYQSAIFCYDTDDAEAINSLENFVENEYRIEPSKNDNSEHGQERERESYKEYKEEKEKKINNLSLSSREREEKFFVELKASQGFLEIVSKNSGLTLEETNAWLEKFIDEIVALEKWHKDFNDCRSHFYNWVRIKIETQKQNNNGGQKISTSADRRDRLSARRPTPIGNEKQDFTEDF